MTRRKVRRSSRDGTSLDAFTKAQAFQSTPDLAERVSALERQMAILAPSVEKMVRTANAIEKQVESLSLMVFQSFAQLVEILPDIQEYGRVRSPPEKNA